MPDQGDRGLGFGIMSAEGLWFGSGGSCGDTGEGAEGGKKENALGRGGPRRCELEASRGCQRVPRARDSNAGLGNATKQQFQKLVLAE